MKRLKSENGILTLEASISLILFVFAFLSILSMAKYIHLQSVMQNAINQTAKEISQYSYILSRLGLDRLTQGTSPEAEEFSEKTDQYISGITDFMGALQDSGETGTAQSYDGATEDFSSKLQSVDVGNIVSKGKELYTSSKDYFDNPSGIISGMVALLGDKAIDTAKSRLIAAPLSKALCRKYIPGGASTADEYLTKFGVMDGLDGLNFNLSTLFSDGVSINIVVVYQVKLQLPLSIEYTMNCKLYASTAGWIASDKNPAGGKEAETEQNTEQDTEQNQSGEGI